MDTNDGGEATEPERGSRGLTRRRAIVLGAGVAAIAGLGAAGLATGALPVPDRLRRATLDQGPDGSIPDAPVGQVTLERRRSEARAREVGFFTAVPDGYGDGAGLPVCLVLHGASATTDDFARFGLPQFLSDAVARGTPPFVLVGVDGGRTRWEGDGGSDDPQGMLRDEVPTWCDERGYDTARIAAHGWSMGGYGSLLLAALDPGWLRAAAVLSPAVGGGQLEQRAGNLDGSRLAIWCGTADSFKPDIEDFAAALSPPPQILEFAPGGHTRGYWNRVTPDAFDFVGARLAE
jgi:hypothetical protein